MGWLNLKERKRVKRKFKVQALYMCDYCNNPIPIWDFPVIDVKAGYHPWPDGVPNGAKCLSAREPKVTYHLHPCNDELTGRRLKTLEYNKTYRKFKLPIRKAIRSVMRRLIQKPVSGYWTKKRLNRSMKHHGERTIKKALKFLRKEKQIRKREGGYIPRI